MSKEGKERIELLLDKEKDSHIIAYLNQNARTRAGYIRQLLHDHVVKNPMEPPSPQPNQEEEKKPIKRTIGNLGGASYSSKNLKENKE